MSGLGDSPVGLSTPFGVGVPDEAVAPPTVRPEQARFLDPTSKDWMIGSDGEYERMPRLRQRVLLAISTELNSSSVLRGFGLTVPERIDETFARRTQHSVRNALQFLITPGELRLDSVTSNQPHPGRTALVISYTDLQTGLPDTVTV